MNFDRVGSVLSSAMVIILGAIIIYHPRWYVWFRQTWIDCTGFNVPLGFALIVVGLLILWTGAIRPGPKEVNLICPKCEELFREKESSGNKCSKCEIDLEPLGGFYERHPERRSGKQKV